MLSKSHNKKYNSIYQSMMDVGLGSDSLLSTKFQFHSMKVVVETDGADIAQHYECV